jgi:hypothetical protein
MLAAEARYFAGSKNTAIWSGHEQYPPVEPSRP